MLYDEIITSLRTCIKCSGCKGCKFDEEVDESDLIGGELAEPDCMGRLMAEAADEIEELSRLHEAQRQNLIVLMNEEPEPKWIPVTERLPEEVRKSYLCRTDSGYHCEVRWTDNVYGLWTGGGGKWGWSIFDIPQYAKVTHWMPLPPAPKEESNGV